MFSDTVFSTTPFSMIMGGDTPIADTNYWNKVCSEDSEWTTLIKDEKDYRECSNGS